MLGAVYASGCETRVQGLVYGSWCVEGMPQYDYQSHVCSYRCAAGNSAKILRIQGQFPVLTHWPLEVQFPMLHAVVITRSELTFHSLLQLQRLRHLRCLTIHLQGVDCAR